MSSLQHLENSEALKKRLGEIYVTLYPQNLKAAEGEHFRAGRVEWKPDVLDEEKRNITIHAAVPEDVFASLATATLNGTSLEAWIRVCFEQSLDEDWSEGFGGRVLTHCSVELRSSPVDG